MRWSGLLVAALMILSAVPVVQAQGSAVEVLTDDSGDVRSEVAGVDAGSPGGNLDYLDLVGATVVEEADAIRFTLTVGSLEPTNQVELTGSYHLFFRHADSEFDVEFRRCFFCITSPPVLDSRLYMRPAGTSDWSFIARDRDGDVEVDASANTVSWAIDRELLADQKGAAPYPGRVLEDFWAQTTTQLNNAAFGFPGSPVEFVPLPVAISDRMPDTGFGPVPVTIELGLQQTGDVVVSSEEPFRASNGEATTFLYRVNITNTGDTEQVFQLQATNVPSQWDISFPIPTAVIAGGSFLEVPVLVNTPFGHQHGGVTSFLVEAHSIGGDIGRIELGVRYLEVPQPAGHHDTVYIHSDAYEPENPFEQVFLTAFGFAGSAYMNTLPPSEDDNDDGTSIPGGLSVDGTTTRFMWQIPLAPALRLGLDFDLSGTGSLIVPLSTTVPIQSTSLTAYLGVVGPYQGRQAPFVFPYGQRTATEVAQATSETFELGLNGDHVVELEFPIRADADLIPYDAEQNLMLVLVLQSDRPSLFITSEDRPLLDPGAELRLPLFEYHDPTETAFQAAAGPQLSIDGPVERLANPGDVLVMDVQIHDQGNAAGTYDLQINGQHDHWGTIDGRARVDLPVSGHLQSRIIVEIPDTAADGDRMDVFVEAIHTSDTTRRGLVRFVVDVDTDAEHDDDSALLAELHGASEDAPALPVLTLLAALVAVAVLRRRVF